MLELAGNKITERLCLVPSPSSASEDANKLENNINNVFISAKDYM